MTKLKSKKMTKSTFALIVLSILMVAMLAFGGTYAYFTSVSNNASGKVTTGIIKLGQNTVALTGQNVVSGGKLLKTTDTAISVSTKNGTETNTAGYWIFAEITADIYETGTTTAVTDATPVASESALAEEGDYFIKLGLAKDGEDNVLWTQVRQASASDTAVYAFHVTKDKAGSTTSVELCNEITFYGWTEFVVDDPTTTGEGKDESAGTGILMGVDIVVSLKAKAVQDTTEENETPITDATTAFNTLFTKNNKN